MIEALNSLVVIILQLVAKLYPFFTVILKGPMYGSVTLKLLTQVASSVSTFTLSHLNPQRLLVYCKCNCLFLFICADDIWMLDVSSLEWTTFRSTKHILPRLWHTASFTEEQDLVIFGGCSNDILSSETLAVSLSGLGFISV